MGTNFCKLDCLVIIKYRYVLQTYYLTIVIIKGIYIFIGLGPGDFNEGMNTGLA